MVSGIILLLEFFVSAWLTRQFCNPTSFFYILDHPNERSLHVNPTPRTGGVAILIALGIGALGLSAINRLEPDLIWLVPGILLLGIVSFLDDRFGVRPVHRLFVHVMAALLLVYGSFVITALELPVGRWEWPTWMAVPVSVLFIVWMINLYNFMDGMDGFAGGMAVIGFGTFALLGLLAGHGGFVMLNLAVMAATGGFLLFNFPPAKIFMGDVGASVLGFLAAAFTLWGARAGIFPFWVAIVVFSPFIFDATVTLLRRLLRGERVWEAHRGHYYQRVVRMGWGHRRTVLWEYALMLLCSVLALAAVDTTPRGQWGVVGVWLAVYVGLMVWVDKRGESGGPSK